MFYTDWGLCKREVACTGMLSVNGWSLGGHVNKSAESWKGVQTTFFRGRGFRLRRM